MGILPIPRVPYHASHAVGGMGILPIPRIPYHVAHVVGSTGIQPKLFTKLVEKSWKRP